VDPERFGATWQASRVIDFLKRRRGKLGAVVITGGEPTFQPDLVSFVKKLKRLGYLVKMDTNGSDPDVIKVLADSRLVDYWAMDVKAPLGLYSTLTRTEINVDKILRSMHILRESGQEYEFRTTFFEPLFDWNDISRIQDLLCPGDRYILQECRYGNTLEDFGRADDKQLNLEESSFAHLQDNPACQTLIRWGGQHLVDIQIRSL